MYESTCLEVMVKYCYCNGEGVWTGVLERTNSCKDNKSHGTVFRHTQIPGLHALEMEEAIVKAIAKAIILIAICITYLGI